jgi:hypothetical protein
MLTYLRSIGVGGRVGSHVLNGGRDVRNSEHYPFIPQGILSAGDLETLIIGRAISPSSRDGSACSWKISVD